MALDDLLTVPEVARLSRLSEKTAYRAIRCGELRASKLRGRWLIRVGDYEEWVRGAVYVPDVQPVVKLEPVAPARGSRAALRRIESDAA